jgi:hypothetical protein
MTIADAFGRIHVGIDWCVLVPTVIPWHLYPHSQLGVVVVAVGIQSIWL